MALLGSTFRNAAYVTRNGFNASMALPALFASLAINTVEHTDSNAFVQSDTIFVLAGGKGRTELALNIAESPQKLVIVGGNKNTRLDDFWEEVQADEEHVYLEKNDIALLSNSLTTEGNAMEIAHWIEQNDVRNAIIVTSDYHAARANFLIQDILPPNVEISFLTLNSQAPLKEWVLETGKLACQMIEPCRTRFTSDPLRNPYNININQDPVLARQ